MTRSELQRAIYQITHGTGVVYWQENKDTNHSHELTLHFTELTEETGAIPSTIGG